MATVKRINKAVPAKRKRKPAVKKDSFLGLGKKAKAKRVEKRSRKKAKTATEALNSYKSVGQKIFPEGIEKISVPERQSKGSILSGIFGDIIGLNKENIPNPEREINPDDAIDSPLLNERKLLPDVVVTNTRGAKKDNTLTYILIAAAVLIIYFITKNKK